MAFVVTTGSMSDEGVVAYTFKTVNQANAYATGRAGYTAHPEEVSNQVEIGWYFWHGEVFDGPQTEATLTTEYKREKLKTIIRKLERLEGLATWSADDLDRGKMYRRWVEMLARASAVDANITDAALYADVLAEASIDGRTWYWLHKTNSWLTYLEDSRAGWKFHTTAGTSTTPNTRIGTERADISVQPGSDFNWVSYLA